MPSNQRIDLLQQSIIFNGSTTRGSKEEVSLSGNTGYTEPASGLTRIRVVRRKVLKECPPTSIQENW